MWGNNYYGQLGLGDKTDRLVPTLLDSSKLGNYKSIKELTLSIGVTKVVVDTDNGEQIYVFGYNDGQLGIGMKGSFFQSTPVLFDTTIFGNYILIKEFYLGWNAAYAIILDNMGNDKIFVWGKNNYGQLGIGNTSIQWRPVLFDTTNFGEYASVREFKINESSYAILERVDGKNELYMWGLNNYGQLGLGSTTNQSTPTKVNAASKQNIKFVKQSYSYWAMFMVVTNNGIDQLYTWGDGAKAQLIHGETTNPGSILTPQLVSQALLYNATEIIQINGAYSMFASVKINGKLSFISWGGNSYGEIMVGSNAKTWIPVLIDNSRLGNPIEVYDSVYTRNMQSWEGHSCYAYVKTVSGDKLYVWGYNTSGQLGVGSTSNVYWPVEVTGLDLSTAKITQFPENFSITNILRLERNNEVEYFGTGVNSSGQLALNNTINSLTFTKILPARYTNPISKSVNSKLTSIEVLNLINQNNVINPAELQKYVDTTSFPTGSQLSIDVNKTTTNLEQGILNLAITTNKYNSPLVLDAIIESKTFEVLINNLWKATNINTNPVTVKAELFPDEVQKTIEQLYNTICDESGKVIDRPLLEQYLDLKSIPPTAELYLSYNTSEYPKQGTFSLEANQVYLNGITTPQAYALKDLAITLGSFPLNFGIIIPLALVGVVLLIITIVTFIYLRKRSYNKTFA